MSVTNAPGRTPLGAIQRFKVRDYSDTQSYRMGIPMRWEGDAIANDNKGMMIVIDRYKESNDQWLFDLGSRMGSSPGSWWAQYRQWNFDNCHIVVCAINNPTTSLYPADKATADENNITLVSLSYPITLAALQSAWNDMVSKVTEPVFSLAFAYEYGNANIHNGGPLWGGYTSPFDTFAEWIWDTEGVSGGAMINYGTRYTAFIAASFGNP